MIYPSWINGVNGNWANGSDWSTGTVPGAGDDVQIQALGTYSVGITSPTTASYIYLSTDNIQSQARLDVHSTLNVGEIFIDGGGLVLDGTLTGDVDVYSTLSGTGTLDGGQMFDYGVVRATTGTLTITDDLALQGTLMAAAGATVVIDGPGSSFGVMNGSGTIMLESDFSFLPGASLAASEVIQSGTVRLGVEYSEFAMTLTNEVGHIYVLDSSAQVVRMARVSSAEGSLIFDNRGTLEQTGSNAAFEQVSVTNTGTIINGDGEMSFISRVTNSGTIIDNSNMVFSNGILGSGTLVLATGAEATLYGPAGGTIDFAGADGSLLLQTPASVQSEIAGFAAGDQVDLVATPETGFSYAGNVLTVMNGTNTVANLHFAGNYDQSDFNLTSDQNGGTLIKLNP